MYTDRLMSPAALASVFNACMAMFLGWTIAGWQGALFGAFGVLAILAASKDFSVIHRYAIRLAVAGKSLPTLVRPLFILLAPLMPIAVNASALIRELTSAAGRVIAPLRAYINSSLSDAFAGLRDFLGTFFVMPVLPITLANIGALAIILGVFTGNKFASFAVFAAIPMMFVVLSAALSEPEASGRRELHPNFEAPNR